MTTLDYATPVTLLDGTKTDLSAHAGKVLLIVNTASQCGLTPQYAGLETLWRDLGERGFVVLGFPCNQFGAQEPGTSDQISTFCETSFGVSFPLYEKVDVNGDNTHALFAQLKKAAPGMLNSSSIKWNFTKFLVDQEGTIVRRYSPKTPPGDIRSDIEALLD